MHGGGFFDIDNLRLIGAFLAIFVIFVRLLYLWGMTFHGDKSEFALMSIQALSSVDVLLLSKVSTCNC